MIHDFSELVRAKTVETTLSCRNKLIVTKILKETFVQTEFLCGKKNLAILLEKTFKNTISSNIIVDIVIVKILT